MQLGKCAVFFLLFFLCAGLLTHAGVPQETVTDQPASGPIAGKWDEGWYHGANGYAQALVEYEKTNKPMVVYFNVGWCPYCRIFENNILSHSKVQAFMQDKGILKVHLNPEDGKRENAIAFQYGVMGFPSFYVHLPQPRGTVRFMTGILPEQFVELFEKVLK